MTKLTYYQICSLAAQGRFSEIPSEYNIVWLGPEPHKCLEANRFIGAHISEMLYSMVTPELYYKFDRHEFWDDGSEMTGEEWAKVTTELLILN